MLRNQVYQDLSRCARRVQDLCNTCAARYAAGDCQLDLILNLEIKIRHSFMQLSSCEAWATFHPSARAVRAAFPPWRNSARTRNVRFLGMKTLDICVQGCTDFDFEFKICAPRTQVFQDQSSCAGLVQRLHTWQGSLCNRGFDFLNTLDFVS